MYLLPFTEYSLYCLDVVNSVLSIEKKLWSYKQMFYSKYTCAQAIASIKCD